MTGERVEKRIMHRVEKKSGCEFFLLHELSCLKEEMEMDLIEMSEMVSNNQDEDRRSND